MIILREYVEGALQAPSWIEGTTTEVLCKGVLVLSGGNSVQRECSKHLHEQKGPPLTYFAPRYVKSVSAGIEYVRRFFQGRVVQAS